jgi:uncharacterized membrane protein
LNLSVRKIVMSGILGAVTILLGATGWGFIPVPTPAGHATIMHIPTILGGVLEGPVVGLVTGAIFGVFSLLRPGAAFFTDPLVSVLPRLFIGVTAYFAFAATKKMNSRLACVISGVVGVALTGYLAYAAIEMYSTLIGVITGIVGIALTVILVYAATRWNLVVACVLAAVVGTATNTILVLGMITFRGYLPSEITVPLAFVHGIPEIAVAAILTVILVKGIQRVRGFDNSLPGNGKYSG